MIYGERHNTLEIFTDTGTTTIKRFLKCILKAKDNAHKNAIFYTVYGDDRQAVIKEMILSVNKGFYNLNSLYCTIQDMYGVWAATEITEKIIRGLSVEYPDCIYAAFTLGLNEIEIK